MVQVNDLIKRLGDQKGEGVNGIGVVINFIGHRVQPIKDRVHPATEYTGRGDPTHESNEPWIGAQLYNRVALLFASYMDVSSVKCPHGYNLVNPADEVCSYFSCYCLFSPSSL